MRVRQASGHRIVTLVPHYPHPHTQAHRFIVAGQGAEVRYLKKKVVKAGWKTGGWWWWSVGGGGLHDHSGTTPQVHTTHAPAQTKRRTKMRTAPASTRRGVLAPHVVQSFRRGLLSNASPRRKVASFDRVRTFFLEPCLSPHGCRYHRYACAVPTLATLS